MNLADELELAGLRVGALELEEMIAGVLERLERALGPDHPRTLAARQARDLVHSARHLLREEPTG